MRWVSLVTVSTAIALAGGGVGPVASAAPFPHAKTLAALASFDKTLTKALGDTLAVQNGLQQLVSPGGGSVTGAAQQPIVAIETQTSQLFTLLNQVRTNETVVWSACRRNAKAAVLRTATKAMGGAVAQTQALAQAMASAFGAVQPSLTGITTNVGQTLAQVNADLTAMSAAERTVLASIK